MEEEVQKKDLPQEAVHCQNHEKFTRDCKVCNKLFSNNYYWTNKDILIECQICKNKVRKVYLYRHKCYKEKRKELLSSVIPSC